ncbi:unnamed protein product [Peniophora sp. CBMAI 1063]|nr:unnamed protein product [Peniophora sp. CBMAI 1063]
MASKSGVSELDNVGTTWVRVASTKLATGNQPHPEKGNPPLHLATSACFLISSAFSHSHDVRSSFSHSRPFISGIFEAKDLFDFVQNPEHWTAEIDGQGRQVLRRGVARVEGAEPFLANTTIVYIKSFDAIDIFAQHIKGHEAFQKLAAARGLDLYALDKFKEAGTLFNNHRFILRIPRPLKPCQPICVARFPKMLSLADCEELFHRWDALMNPSDNHRFTFHSPDPDNRSATPAAHFGCWSHSQKAPYVTADSRQEDPVMEERVAHFLKYVCESVVPQAGKMLHKIAPEQVEIAKKVEKRCVQKCGKVLTSRKWLRFKYFATLAVKEGSSEKAHLDFLDTKELATLALEVGTHKTTSFFVLPQLGLKIEFCPGASGKGLPSHRPSLSVDESHRGSLSCETS